MPRRTARRHVIVSQGGKTGAGGTFLRDQRVPPKVADVLPEGLVAVEHEPGERQQVAVAAEPAPAAEAAPRSLPPPTTPTPQVMENPGSVKALRRWSLSKMQRLAEQEGIKAEGLDKNGLRSLLAAHLGLK